MSRNKTSLNDPNSNAPACSEKMEHPRKRKKRRRKKKRKNTTPKGSSLGPSGCSHVPSPPASSSSSHVLWEETSSTRSSQDPGSLGEGERAPSAAGMHRRAPPAGGRDCSSGTRAVGPEAGLVAKGEPGAREADPVAKGGRGARESCPT